MIFTCTVCNNSNGGFDRDRDPNHKTFRPVRYHMWIRHLASPEHQDNYLAKFPNRPADKFFLDDACFVIVGISSRMVHREWALRGVAVWLSEFGVLTEFVYYPKEECFVVTLQAVGMGPVGPGIERVDSLVKERKYQNCPIRVFRKSEMTFEDWSSITRGTLAEVLRVDEPRHGGRQQPGTQARKDYKPKTSVDNKENFNNQSATTATSADDVVDAHENKDDGRQKSNKHRKNAREGKTSFTSNSTTTHETRQKQQVDVTVMNDGKSHRSRVDGQSTSTRGGRGRGRTSRVVIPPSAHRNQPDYAVIGKSVSGKEHGDLPTQTQAKEPTEKINLVEEIASQQCDATENEEGEVTEMKNCESQLCDATESEEGKVEVPEMKNCESQQCDSTEIETGKVEVPEMKICESQQCDATEREEKRVEETEMKTCASQKCDVTEIEAGKVEETELKTCATQQCDATEIEEGKVEVPEMKTCASQQCDSTEIEAGKVEETEVKNCASQQLNATESEEGKVEVPEMKNCASQQFDSTEIDAGKVEETEMKNCASQQCDSLEIEEGKMEVPEMKICEERSPKLAYAKVTPAMENRSVAMKEAQEVNTSNEANLHTEVPVKTEERIVEEPDFMDYAMYWYRF